MSTPTSPDAFTNFQGPVLAVLPPEPTDPPGRRSVLTALGLTTVPTAEAVVGRLVTLTRVLRGGGAAGDGAGQLAAEVELQLAQAPDHAEAL